MSASKRLPPLPRPGSWRDGHRQALAQRFSMGLMSPRAERVFRAWLAQDAQLQASVNAWQHVQGQLSMHTPPLEPSPVLWKRIEHALGPASAASLAAKPQDPASAGGLLGFVKRTLSALFGFGAPPGDAGAASAQAAGVLRRRRAAVWQLGAAALVGALATAFLLGRFPSPGLAPQPIDAPMPASYVGVLTDSGDQAQMVVASLRYSRVVQLKLVKPLVVPEGSSAVLWGLGSTGTAVAIARLPAGAEKRVALNLEQPAEQAFAKVTRLAITVEPNAVGLPAAPSGPFILSGHCAKVW